MQTVSLLAFKSLLYQGTLDSPEKYYESPHAKCFLGPPQWNRSVARTIDKDYDPEDPDELHELVENFEDFPVTAVNERFQFYATVADPEGLHVVEIIFRFPGDSDTEEMTARALEFIGQCRFEENISEESNN